MLPSFSVLSELPLLFERGFADIALVRSMVGMSSKMIFYIRVFVKVFITIIAEVELVVSLGFLIVNLLSIVSSITTFHYIFIIFFILLLFLRTIGSIVNNLTMLLSLKLNRIHCLLFYNIIFHLINLIRLGTQIRCCSSEFLIFQSKVLAVRSNIDLRVMVWHN